MAPPTIAAVSGLMRNVIHYHIDHHNLDNALFFAERLQAHDPRSNESAYLVALCHYHLGDFCSAHNATKLAGMRGTHLGCSYIFAQSCLELEYFKDGISALEKAKSLWISTTSLGKHTATSRATFPDGPSVLCLLGKMYRGFKDQKKAILCFEESLKGNPFMWDAITLLCEMNQDVKVPSIYRFTESLFQCFAPENAPAESRQGTPLFPTEVQAKKASLRNGAVTYDDPFEAHRPSNLQNVYQNPQDDPSDVMARLTRRPGMTSSTTIAADSDGMETPQVAPTKSETSLPQGVHNAEAPPAPIRRTRTAQTTESGILDAPPKMSYRLGTKRGQRPQVHEDGQDAAIQPATKSTVGAISAIERKRTVSGQPRAAEDPGAPQRRSARLNMFKTTSKATTGVSAVGATGTRELKKTRAPISRIMRPGSSGSNVGRVVSGNRKPVEDNNHMDVDHVDQPRGKESSAPLPAVVKQNELESIKTEEALKWILELMKKISNGYVKLSKYEVDEALKFYNMLPPGQKESPWILAQVGRAYYEKADYVKAETFFRKLRHIAPSRTEDMEVYSTILWFLKKEVELSFLSHELVDTAWDCPQAWCAVGNAMSLTRDHEGALKSFKRATQLNPKFAYAHTLQGHEHIANEEYDRALTCYRNALSADPRHYNGYYGIGRVYEKLGSYDKALTHFQAASQLNPRNAVLVMCVGNVLEQQKQLLPALQCYSKAVELSPNAAQARYKMSRALLATGHLEQARQELMILKDLAPDEANVHFLLGKLYKTLNQNGLAIRHFTIALNLDPRASSQIKEAIESLEDDDGMDDSMIG
ncbi:hypothetical protein MKZ38_007283 [Zalerion maritima]|uniref:Uncharacterized protein n=1 Tax=Zalerion maritima TaxID=339359 RepID=A0AAD5WPA1_9PEZI|nr:hypothetical protein MKZ38_007283 [Zalerion maritima]